MSNIILVKLRKPKIVGIIYFDLSWILKFVCYRTERHKNVTYILTEKIKLFSRLWSSLFASLVTASIKTVFSLLPHFS